MLKRPVASHFKGIVLDAIFLAAIVTLVVVFRHSVMQPAVLPTVQAKQPAIVASLPVPVTATNILGTAMGRAKGPLPENPHFRERPFPAAYESPHERWTLGDSSL